MQPATIFRALGDPTRLELVRRLAAGQLYTLTSVSQDLAITRQGARKHLQILADAELVHFSVHGRETLVSLDRKTLEQGKAFIAQMEQAWEDRLHALKDFVEGSTNLS